jgi:hypothetical protein
VRSDKVSIEYRRWLRELADAVDDPVQFAAVLHADQPVPQGALR